MREKDAAGAGPGNLPQIKVRTKAESNQASGEASGTPAPTSTLCEKCSSSATIEQAYFEQIIENAPEAVSIIDAKKCVFRVNNEFARLFGFPGGDWPVRRSIR